MQTRTVIFTDLDGTLLNHEDYSFAAARPALDLARHLHIPVIPVTSKTAPEVVELRRRLDNTDPFIVENGAAIAIAPQSAMFRADSPAGADGLCWIELARETHRWQSTLREILRQGRFAATPLSAMSPEQLVEATGLDPDAARAARNRRYGEPLLWRDSDDRKHELGEALRAAGLGLLQGGRFLHVQDQGIDKGRAIGELLARWRGEGRPRTIGLGDSGNDVALLEAVDHAVLIKSPAHEFPAARGRVDTRHSTLPGPAGWNAAIRALITD